MGDYSESIVGEHYGGQLSLARIGKIKFWKSWTKRRKVLWVGRGYTLQYNGGELLNAFKQTLAREVEVTEK